MSDDPIIPFGYRAVTGQLQKGDGIYDPALGKFVKVKKVATQVTVTKMRYPIVHQCATVAIRRCEVEQAELPVITQPEPIPTVSEPVCTDPERIVTEPRIYVTNGNGVGSHLDRHDYELLKKSGMLWEFHPDAPAEWPLDDAVALPEDNK